MFHLNAVSFMPAGRCGRLDALAEARPTFAFAFVQHVPCLEKSILHPITFASCTNELRPQCTIWRLTLYSDVLFCPLSGHYMAAFSFRPLRKSAGGGGGVFFTSFTVHMYHL